MTAIGDRNARVNSVESADGTPIGSVSIELINKALRRRGAAAEPTASGT